MLVNDMEYIDRKCQDCGKQFEVRVDKQDTLYGDYCALCFFANVRLYADGSMEQKEKVEKNTDYKKELQEVTHRGKTRTQTD